jgi:hypothetical protein
MNFKDIYHCHKQVINWIMIENSLAKTFHAALCGIIECLDIKRKHIFNGEIHQFD